MHQAALMLCNPPIWAHTPLQPGSKVPSPCIRQPKILRSSRPGPADCIPGPSVTCKLFDIQRSAFVTLIRRRHVCSPFMKLSLYTAKSPWSKKIGSPICSLNVTRKMTVPTEEAVLGTGRSAALTFDLKARCSVRVNGFSARLCLLTYC